MSIKFSKSNLPVKINLLEELVKYSNLNDTNKVIETLELCDSVHNGIDVEKYILPPDDIYERYVKQYNYQSNNTVESINSVLPMGSLLKKPIPDISVSSNGVWFKELDQFIYMPKFDGVSVSCLFELSNSNDYQLHLTKANTRGVKIGHQIISSNLTYRLNQLINYIDVSQVSVKGVKSIISLKLRGEVINNYKSMDVKTLTFDVSHASRVSGIINGSVDNFIKNKNELCLQFYEIGSMTIKDTNDNIITVTPKQINSLKILNLITVNYNYSKDGELSILPRNNVPAYYTSEITLVENFKYDIPTYYNKILNTCPYPTDGVVYSLADWKYPLDYTKHNKVDYGKYAWKPDNIFQTTFKSVQWSLTEKGEMIPMIHYTTIVSNGKSYSSTRTTYTKLLEFIKQGLSDGCIITIKIINSISPYLLGIIPNSNSIQVSTIVSNKVNETKYIPTTCPSCGLTLTIQGIHLMCLNTNCSKQIISKYAKLIKYINKSQPLIFKNELGNVVKTTLSDKRLSDIYLINGKLNIEILLKYIPNLITNFEKLELKEQLIALGVCVSNNVDKYIKNNSIQTYHDVNVSWFC